MPIQVHPVAYGAPATERLAALVAAAQGPDRLRVVTVIVPTNYVGVTARRALAARPPGVAAVRFLTPYRLAELLGAAGLAAAGRRPVSTPVVAAAVRRAFADRPGVLAPVADHPSTVEALVGAYRELRDITPSARKALARTSRRAADVVRVHDAVAGVLRPRWYDETDLVGAAVAAVEAGAPFAAEVGTVIVHLPQELGLGAARLLRAVAADGLQVVAGLTGAADADAGVQVSLARLGAPPLEGAPTVGPLLPGPPPQVITASDADDEVRAAVRRIVDAARAGVRFDRMVVAYGHAEPYARLVTEHLTAADIPHNGPAAVRLRERVAARTLLAALALADHDVSRAGLFALLASAPARLPDGRPVPTAAWERISREAGVVAGRSQWDERLTRLASSLKEEAAAAEADAESPAWLPERLHRQSDQATALSAYALDLCDRLDPTRLPTTWRGLAQFAHALLARLVGPDPARGRWPASEGGAADALAAAIDRLGGLDEIDGGTTIDTFARTLELELDADLGRVGRLGDGVFVGPVGMVLGQHADLTVVLGLAEGTFPARPTDDGLLPDHERRAAGGELALRADTVGRQHRHLLAAIAATAESGAVVLGVPRGDLRRSQHRLASRWVLDLVERQGGQRVASAELFQRSEPWITMVPSFAAGISSLGFAPTAQEHRLRALASGSGPPDDLVLAPRMALVRARRGSTFTVFDGNLSGKPIPSPFTTGDVVSPTRLEAWSRCPHAYLFAHVLKVKPTENPEDLLQMSALDKGNLIHETLDRFLTGVLERPPERQPGPTDAWTADDHDELGAVFASVAAGYEGRGLTGRDLFWRRDRRILERDLHEFLRRDDHRRHAMGARPIASELSFGRRGARLPAVTVDAGGGRTVRFRGSADRVDRTADGLLVVDYKSGRADPYNKLSVERPDLDGTRLQLPVYALAARLEAGEPDAAVRAEYWFVTDKGKWATRGYPVDDAILARFATVLDTIGDGIAAGVFPPRPVRPGFHFRVDCPHCDPDGLGTGEVWRQWDRKRGAPELSAYLALVEPDG